MIIIARYNQVKVSSIMADNEKIFVSIDAWRTANQDEEGKSLIEVAYKNGQTFINYKNETIKHDLSLKTYIDSAVRILNNYIG